MRIPSVSHINSMPQYPNTVPNQAPSNAPSQEGITKTKDEATIAPPSLAKATPPDAISK